MATPMATTLETNATYETPLITALETPLITALEQLAPHDHLCSIYESTEEHFAVAIPFIRFGLERGEKCIYIADEGTEEEVRDAMYAQGIDVERAIATDSLVLEKKEDAYLKHGSFDPDWMFTFWANATAEAKSQGFSALRATGETEWVVRGAPGMERWMEYESRMTHELAHHNCVALCQYNRKLFSPELIRDVIRTHPTVIYRGVVCRNMYYVPPDELLGTNQAAREVERLLTSIREREEIEAEARRQVEERRRSHDAVRESEQRWRSVFENSAVGMVVGDATANILASNQAFQELVGYSSEELRKLTVYDLTYEADVPRNIELRAELLSGARREMQMEKRLRRKDHRLLWVRVTSSLIPGFAGTPDCIVALVEDITNRKLAEEELQRSERLLRLVLDALPVGVGVVDNCGDIILSNPASQRIWGGTILSGADRYAESKGWWHTTGKRVAPEDWPSVRAFANGRTTVNDVIEIEAFDGVRKILQTSAVPIRDNSDRVTGAVVVLEDISASKTAERELSDSYNQMRTMTARLMRAQDDERRRIAQLLHETTAQDLAALKMHLARLNRTATHLSDTERAALTESVSLAEQSITEIRTLSYLLHPPFLDEAGLVSALRWYAAGFADRSSIKVDLELPESFERLPRDTETALFRIVQESLINIHRHAGSETARIRLRRDAETLVLEIEDQGCGMSDALLGQIMSGGGGGVGVGIAGMYERIEQLGGSFEITSGDVGTTVRARLPLGRDAG